MHHPPPPPPGHVLPPLDPTHASAGRYSLAEFVGARAQRDRGHGLFELESERMLEVNLNGDLWTKTGSMVAYLGAVKFTREGILEHGIGKFLKRAVSGEGTQLTKAQGQGKLYLADEAKKISILKLHNEAIFVNGNDVLAFEPSLKWDITLMRSMAGMFAGGLFNVRFEGSGMLAITTHYDPLALEVRPGQPVFTDPNATVAWSGTLQPQIHTDVSFKTFFGRGSGESIQLRFEGSGFVLIQPKEEVYFQQQTGG
ncbi:MAG: AIM24 family protein [Planctomycetota bacterium]|nr:AIM24 family protein [Planctomycetota bacterium]